MMRAQEPPALRDAALSGTRPRAHHGRGRSGWPVVPLRPRRGAGGGGRERARADVARERAEACTRPRSEDPGRCPRSTGRRRRSTRGVAAPPRRRDIAKGARRARGAAIPRAPLARARRRRGNTREDDRGDDAGLPLGRPLDERAAAFGTIDPEAGPWGPAVSVTLDRQDVALNAWSCTREGLIPSRVTAPPRVVPRRAPAGTLRRRAGELFEAGPWSAKPESRRSSWGRLPSG